MSDITAPQQEPNPPPPGLPCFLIPFSHHARKVNPESNYEDRQRSSGQQVALNMSPPVLCNVEEVVIISKINNAVPIKAAGD